MCFIHGNLVNLYISYELDAYSRDLMHQDLITDFMLVNCLLGAVKWVKDDPLNKYGYSSYGIGFDACAQFFWADRSWC